MGVFQKPRLLREETVRFTPSRMTNYPIQTRGKPYNSITSNRPVRFRVPREKGINPRISTRGAVPPLDGPPIAGGVASRKIL